MAALLLSEERGSQNMAALLLSEERGRKIYGVNERCGQSNGTGG